MNTTCGHCGAPLAQAWTYCPHCGLAITHQTTASLPTPAAHSKSSLRGAYGGLLFGVIAAPVLIIVGTLLCLTGLGAFLGVPMIVVGIIAPLAGPLIGIGEHQGKCPACGTAVISVTDGQDHHCPACSHDFALRKAS